MPYTEHLITNLKTTGIALIPTHDVISKMLILKGNNCFSIEMRKLEARAFLKRWIRLPSSIAIFNIFKIKNLYLLQILPSTIRFPFLYLLNISLHVFLPQLIKSIQLRKIITYAHI